MAKDENGENETQRNESKGLSKFEWFGLVSGIVGLTADIFSLSSLFRHSQLPDSGGQSLTFTTWITVLLVILYTILILSFYIRRRMIQRLEENKKYRFDFEKKEHIENGIMIFTCLIGIPLLVLHSFFLYDIMRESLMALDVAQLKQLTGYSQIERVMFRYGFGFIIISPLFSWVLCILMERIANAIYSAIKK